jgi:hypothetical protein
MSLCRNNYDVRTWTSSTSADGKRRSECTVQPSAQALPPTVLHSRELRVGDLVLRRVLNREGLHKLSPSWEGPFKVTEVCRPGCVRLATTEGEPLPNPWNIEHLYKFFP